MSIVALLPADAEAVTIPSGDPLELLHVTIAYLGDENEGPDAQTVADALAGLPELPTVTATVAGVGTLGDAGAVVLFLESASLNELHDLVVDTLDTAGIPDVGGHPQFICHLTVGYAEGDPTDLITAALPLQGSTITFDRIAAIDGDDIVPIGPLDGRVPDAAEGDDGDEFAGRGKDPNWDESKVKRADDGKFDKGSDGGGGGSRGGGLVKDATPIGANGRDTPTPKDTDGSGLAAPMAKIDLQSLANDQAGKPTNETWKATQKGNQVIFEGQTGGGQIIVTFGDDGAAHIAINQNGTSPQDVHWANRAVQDYLDQVNEGNYNVVPTSDPTAGETPASPAPTGGGRAPAKKSAPAKKAAPTAPAAKPASTPKKPSIQRNPSTRNPINIGGGVRVASAAYTEEATVMADTDTVDTPTVADDTVARYAEWEGVLVVEGVPTGDGRIIEPGGLTWRDFPLPYMLMTRNPVGGEGHDGAELAGRIDWIERRDDGEIWAGGVFDLGCEAGREAARLHTPDAKGRVMMRGVSIDLDSIDAWVEEGVFTSSPFGGLLHVDTGRIMGVTGTVFPAQQEAQIALVSEALAAALTGGVCDCDILESLVAACGAPADGVQIRLWIPSVDSDAVVAAAGIPTAPPAAWFAKPTLDGPTPLHVEADGRVYGHVATWESCHIGLAGCQRPPRSASKYAYFANKQTLTAEGVMVSTGPIIIDTVHPNLAMHASDAQAWYHDTGCAVADVAVYEDEWGICVAGAARSDATAEQMRRLRGADVSPDWRKIGGRLECVAMLSVNASGFITPALVAAASDLDPTAGSKWLPPGHVAARVETNDGETEIVALVAAGMVLHQVEPSETDQLRADLEQLRVDVAPLVDRWRNEQHAQAVARFADLVEAREERRAAAAARFAAARARFLANAGDHPRIDE